MKDPRMIRAEDGATAVEYGLMVALIAIVIVGAVTLFGVSLRSSFENDCLQFFGAGNC
jgi:pilus assembly protein Flp/PilA